MKSLKVAQMPEVSSWISDGRQLEYRLSITATCRQRQTVAESAEQATSRRSRCKPLTPQRRKTQPSTYANLDALASSRGSNCRGRPGDAALRPGGGGAWSQSFAQCPLRFRFGRFHCHLAGCMPCGEGISQATSFPKFLPVSMPQRSRKASSAEVVGRFWFRESS